eukprot:6756517-Pyramimonas_sp.AAC.1
MGSGQMVSKDRVASPMHRRRIGDASATSAWGSTGSPSSRIGDASANRRCGTTLRPRLLRSHLGGLDSHEPQSSGLAYVAHQGVGKFECAASAGPTVVDTASIVRL